MHGAFEPVIGIATLIMSLSRGTTGHTQLLEEIETDFFPPDRHLIVEDNLSIHGGRQRRRSAPLESALMSSSLGRESMEQITITGGFSIIYMQNPPFSES